jgi:hypothetical protein
MTAEAKVVVLRADHHQFGWMLLIAASRKLDMKEVLQHPLGPLHWSLANNEGEQSCSGQAYRKGCNPYSWSAAVIDGMAQVQKIDGDNRTFAEILEQIFKTALRTHSASQCMHAVCMYGFLRVQEAGLLVSINFRTCWAKKCVHPW